MDNNFAINGVRTRLILSGINEIEEHGINDFSLRRVAVSAQVSCAAPYRHFKDKDDFIAQIVGYIGYQWNLLFEQITLHGNGDLKTLIKNVCISYVKFWQGNLNFKNVLLSTPNGTEIIGFDNALKSLVTSYVNHEEFAKRKFFVIRSLVYGAILLCGFDNSDEIISGLSIALDKEI